MKDLVPEITSFIIFIHSDLCLSLKIKRDGNDVDRELKLFYKSNSH